MYLYTHTCIHEHITTPTAARPLPNSPLVVVGKLSYICISTTKVLGNTIFEEVSYYLDPSWISVSDSLIS